MGELSGLDAVARALLAERERELRAQSVAAGVAARDGASSVLERELRVLVGRGMVRLGGWVAAGGVRIAGVR